MSTRSKSTQSKVAFASRHQATAACLLGVLIPITVVGCCLPCHSRLLSRLPAGPCHTIDCATCANQPAGRASANCRAIPAATADRAPVTIPVSREANSQVFSATPSRVTPTRTARLEAPAVEPVVANGESSRRSIETRKDEPIPPSKIESQDPESSVDRSQPSNTLIFEMVAPPTPAPNDEIVPQEVPAEVQQILGQGIELGQVFWRSLAESTAPPAAIADEEVRQVIVQPPVALKIELTEAATMSDAAAPTRLTAVPRLSPANLPPLVRFRTNGAGDTVDVPAYAITIEPITPKSDRRPIDDILEGHRTGRRLETPAESNTRRR